MTPTRKWMSLMLISAGHLAMLRGASGRHHWIIRISSVATQIRQVKFALQICIPTWHFILSKNAFQTGMKMHFKFVYYGISSWRFNFALQISISIWQLTLAFQSGGSTWHLKLALPISIANWHFNLALPKTAQDIQGDSKPQKSMSQDIFKHSRWLKTAKRISLKQL